MSSIFAIDPMKLVADVRQLAAERPDYIYDGPTPGTCFYFHGPGEPGCIIGHALAKQGMSWDDMSGDNESDNHPAWATLASNVTRARLRGEPVPLHDGWYSEDMHFLTLVQQHQDQHNRWSEAITYADNGGQE